MFLPDPQLLGVVLCGGASKRMGRDKADLTTPSGESFLEHACRRLQQHCGTVCVSSSRTHQTEFQQIPDLTGSHGPISGIHASLSFAKQRGFDACVFTPVDTPCLTSSDLTTLITAFTKHRCQVVCAVSQQTPEQIEPLIAIYSVTLAGVISDWIDQGQYSPQRFLQSRPIITVRLSAEACRNVNTPSDLDQQSPKP